MAASSCNFAASPWWPANKWAPSPAASPAAPIAAVSSNAFSEASVAFSVKLAASIVTSFARWPASPTPSPASSVSSATSPTPFATPSPASSVSSAAFTTPFATPSPASSVSSAVFTTPWATPLLTLSESLATVPATLATPSAATLPTFTVSSTATLPTSTVSSTATLLTFTVSLTATLPTFARSFTVVAANFIGALIMDNKPPPFWYLLPPLLSNSLSSYLYPIISKISLTSPLTSSLEACSNAVLIVKLYNFFSLPSSANFSNNEIASSELIIELICSCVYLNQSLIKDLSSNNSSLIWESKLSSIWKLSCLISIFFSGLTFDFSLDSVNLADSGDSLASLDTLDSTESPSAATASSCFEAAISKRDAFNLLEITVGAGLATVSGLTDDLSVGIVAISGILLTSPTRLSRDFANSSKLGLIFIVGCCKLDKLIANNFL